MTFHSGFSVLGSVWVVTRASPRERTIYYREDKTASGKGRGRIIQEARRICARGTRGSVGQYSLGLRSHCDLWQRGLWPVERIERSVS